MSTNQDPFEQSPLEHTELKRQVDLLKKQLEEHLEHQLTATMSTLEQGFADTVAAKINKQLPGVSKASVLNQSGNKAILVQLEKIEQRLTIIENHLITTGSHQIMSGSDKPANQQVKQSPIIGNIRVTDRLSGLKRLLTRIDFSEFYGWIVIGIVALVIILVLMIYKPWSSSIFSSESWIDVAKENPKNYQLLREFGFDSEKLKPHAMDQAIMSQLKDNLYGVEQLDQLDTFQSKLLNNVLVELSLVHKCQTEASLCGETIIMVDGDLDDCLALLKSWSSSEAFDQNEEIQKLLIAKLRAFNHLPKALDPDRTGLPVSEAKSPLAQEAQAPVKAIASKSIEKRWVSFFKYPSKPIYQQIEKILDLPLEKECTKNNAQHACYKQAWVSQIQYNRLAQEKINWDDSVVDNPIKNESYLRNILFHSIVAEACLQPLKACRLVNLTFSKMPGFVIQKVIDSLPKTVQAALNNPSAGSIPLNSDNLTKAAITLQKAIILNALDAQ